MALAGLDYWRLADDLSVVDAAILITGNNPEQKLRRDGDDFVPYWVQDRSYEGYEGAFKALRFAILSDKLRATVTFRARDPVVIEDSYKGLDGEIIPHFYTVDANGDEVSVPYDTLMRTSDCKRSIFANREFSKLENATTLYVLKEPCWEETTVAVEDLKAWLSTRGLAPSFFFPQGKPEGFRDPTHPRYSPKLACAVAAWEAVKKARPNKTPKATIGEWVQANAVRFGMVEPDGIPSSKAVSEVSTVANWATGGGATPTYTGVNDEVGDVPKDIQNFPFAEGDSDREIPF